MKKILVIVLAAIFFGGCATQTYLINGNGGSSPDKEKLQPFFINGIGQEQRMNAADICGGAEKVAKVQSKQNFLDGFLGLLSFGIYTPRTAMVYCIRE